MRIQFIEPSPNPTPKIFLRILSAAADFRHMNPGLMLLANSSFPVSLYDFHLDGISARELAKAYSLPLTWVEERLEAVRLCVKYQVDVSIATKPAAPAQVRPVPPSRTPKDSIYAR
jgi:hypothetical protein